MLTPNVVQDLIDYTDKIYLEFGADTHVEGAEETQEIREIRKSATIAGLKLVDCPIRHLGTEKAHELYYEIEKHLINNGVEILANNTCTDVLIENEICTGAVVEGEKIFADKVIIATGRKGADWLDNMCRLHGIGREAGVVDIGVRVEVRNEVMDGKALTKLKLLAIN